ncbi:sodium-dependent bicarbonate transport family permease [Tepidimonas taiwanensis]|uniref:sodium-dependent bicarbonate transport family permease n=1 Tax=Tepidimonas taiwanensis TaxID=307486 RepID=UPI0005BD1E70|nr:sodium-dependent bicarbonate transport family permease [Tepidimonas taiwanensis]
MLAAIDPVVGFFVLGLVAGLLGSDLKLSSGLYDTLTIYLLIAIGLKGGFELASRDVTSLILPTAVIVAASAVTPMVAYQILLRLGRLPHADAASISAHYGSVSVVTFAVGASYLGRQGLDYDGFMSVFLVFLEFPALIVGVLLAKGLKADANWRRLAHEVLTGKAIVLLLGALLIGWIWGREGGKALVPFFEGLFKGFLALFLLGMGVTTAARFGDLRRVGLFLVGFGILMPIVSAAGGVLVGWLLGLSVGNTHLLAVLYASASYIAAPAAMRIAIPEANPALSMGASLGVTFPFNVVAGVPLYLAMTQTFYRMMA